MKKAVIVLPTYNESENIEDMITLILAEQAKVKDWEINVLVSDSNSPDGTAGIVSKIIKTGKKVSLLNVKERGIGIGLVLGYKHAVNQMGADAVIQMDADMQHDPKEIPNFLKAIDEGHDFVQGSRFITGGKNELEWYRRFFSRSANIVSRYLLGIKKVHEFTTSYRAFTKNLFLKINLDDIPWQGTSFVFQPAFLYAAYRAKAKITEIPIVFVDRSRGISKMQIIRYIMDLLVFGVRTRIKYHSQMIKFGMVGTTGFIINTLGLEIFVKLGFHPATSGAFGAELAIISNFILNNFWTFNERKIHPKNIPLKFIQFNTTSFGAIVIQWLSIWTGVFFFGLSFYRIAYIIGVGIGMFWNYTMYSRVIWSKKTDIQKS